MKKFWGVLFIGLTIWLLTQIDFETKSFSEACPFCQEKNLKKSVFYENEKAFGFLTYKPVVPGHVLIIPKRHVTRFEELESEEIAAIGEAIKKVDEVVRGLYGNTGYALLEKNGWEAGQTVPHVHFHYLPRSNETSQFSFLIRFFLRPLFKPLSEEEICSTREAMNT